MRLPADRLIIDRRKLTHYLLVRKDNDDKSRFLTMCGYTLENVNLLEAAIRELVAANDAVSDSGDEFGQRYRVTGQLPALAGRDMVVSTIWIMKVGDTNIWRFVTLFPGGK